MSERNQQEATANPADDAKYKFSADWIKELESEDHWRLYWKQQDLLKDHLEAGDTLLEIGVGTGFTANYLRSKGHEVTTFDIDTEKQPDVVGNIVHHEFDREYDHILAFEVFEHIPYDEFIQTLRMLRKTCRKTLCLSIPLGKRQLFLGEIKIPRLKKRQISLKIPKRKLWEHHFWEVGYQGNSQKQLVADLESNGFKLAKTEIHLMRLFVVCVAS